jgi:hypothetical protein
VERSLEGPVFSHQADVVQGGDVFWKFRSLSNQVHRGCEVGRHHRFSSLAGIDRQPQPNMSKMFLSVLGFCAWKYLPFRITSLVDACLDELLSELGFSSSARSFAFETPSARALHFTASSTVVNFPRYFEHW